MTRKEKAMKKRLAKKIVSGSTPFWFNKVQEFLFAPHSKKDARVEKAFTIVCRI